MIRQAAGAVSILIGAALLLGLWTPIPQCLVSTPAACLPLNIYCVPAFCALPNPFFFMNQLLGVVALIFGIALAATGRRKGRK